MEEKQIQKFLRKAKCRLGINALLQNYLLYVAAGFLGGAVVCGIALFVPIYHSFNYAVGIALAVMGIGFIVTMVSLPRKKKLALVIDKTGLKEQLTTFLELEGKEDAISVLQKKQTCRSIAGYSFKKQLPIKYSVTNLMLVVFALLAFITAALMPSDMKDQAIANHQVKEEMVKKAEKVKKVAKEIKQDPEITEEEIETYKKLLEDSLKEIQKSKEKTDLKKTADRLETKLKKQLEKDNGAGKEKIQQLLEKNNLLNLSDNEKAVAKAKEELKDAFAQLNKNLQKAGSEDGQKQQEELKALSQSLEKAVEENNLTKDNMKELLQSLEAANASLSNGKAGKQTMNNLQAQMSSMLEATNSGEATASDQATASFQQGQSGQGNPVSGAAMNGNGSSGKDGSMSGGNGGSGQGGGYSRGSKNGMEQEFQQSDNPENVAVSEWQTGQDKNLTGKKSGDNTYTQKTENAPAWAGNIVNYNQVVGKYANEAYSNLEHGNVPDAMKNIVKSYFEGLTQ